jgi:hypothetical protein
LKPVDFSAEDYERLGIPALEGNEAIANFSLFLGINVYVIGIGIIDKPVESHLDFIQLCTDYGGIDCGNFVTPFGADENGVPREFPLPDLILNPDLTQLKLNIAGFSIGIGLKVNPDFGSDKITADWSATQSGAGNGEITYISASPASFDIAPVQTSGFDTHPSALNKVKLTIDNYKYYLTRQTLTLAANIQLSLLGYPLKNTEYYDLLNFDLTEIFGEPAIGQHEGTSGVTLQIPISPVIGGEILGTDTTSLFVAGAAANMYWIAPAVGSVAGASAILIRRYLRK